MLPMHPWVPVVAPIPGPPPDRPVTVWVDTGSGPGLDVELPAAERWRLWPVAAGRHVLLSAREDRDALAILANAYALWGSGDPGDEQDPL